MEGEQREEAFTMKAPGQHKGQPPMMRTPDVIGQEGGVSSLVFFPRAHHSGLARDVADEARLRMFYKAPGSNSQGHPRNGKSEKLHSPGGSPQDQTDSCAKARHRHW